MNQQLLNNLRPTRHLRVKFLANSHRIKNATEQYTLGLISTWQFLNICSYTSAAYELRQRNWALRINEIHEEQDIPLDDPVVNPAVPLPLPIINNIDDNIQNIINVHD